MPLPSPACRGNRYRSPLRDNANRKPATTEFAPGEKIIVSIRTDAGMPADATVAVKLTYQDGQKAGDQSVQVKTENAGTTYIAFTTAPPWPAGNYTADVTMSGQPFGTAQTITVK